MKNAQAIRWLFVQYKPVEKRDQREREREKKQFFFIWTFNNIVKVLFVYLVFFRSFDLLASTLVTSIYCCCTPKFIVAIIWLVRFFNSKLLHNIHRKVQTDATTHLYIDVFGSVWLLLLKHFRGTFLPKVNFARSQFSSLYQ